MYLNTGDRTELEENIEFEEKYINEWNTISNSIILLNAIAALFLQISDHNIDWYSISEDCLLGELGEIIGECFEEVYTNPSGGYKYSELELRITQICASNTFSMMMLCLMKDMEEALNSEGKSVQQIEKLKNKYNKAFLFPKTECEKLVQYFI